MFLLYCLFKFVVVHSEDDWKEYHTKLLEGGASWKEFGETFYERGKSLIAYYDISHT